MEFAIWAIAGSDVMAKDAAEATLGRDITYGDPTVIGAIKEHTPGSWMQLQDLHIRHANAVKRFFKWTYANPDEEQDQCETCYYLKAEVIQSVEP